MGKEQIISKQQDLVNTDILANISVSEMSSFENIINHAWANKDHYKNDENAIKVIANIMDFLDLGKIRVAQKQDETWIVNHWIKKAILLSFYADNQLVTGGPGNLGHSSSWYDKVNLKFLDWDQEKFEQSAFRVAPGAIVRHAAYVAPRCILMPCFLNVGCYVDSGSMIDSWVTIGSCAQIGKNCHISAHTLIGGVLEPLQANPVIIEDDCFIGAASQICEGVIIEQGAVLAAGVTIGASTKIYNRSTGETHYGHVPAYSVVVPGTISSDDKCAVAGAIIVKKVDAKTREKTSINELLRT